ncbi:hypothetical protein [Streptomyces sp. NPDC004783]|uniref:hypothetical protein n=1 Tax=Streptomyces sp. NPDC004783 TaxID=3154459 RepID=UPI0033B5CE38
MGGPALGKDGYAKPDRPRLPTVAVGVRFAANVVAKRLPTACTTRKEPSAAGWCRAKKEKQQVGSRAQCAGGDS